MFIENKAAIFGCIKTNFCYLTDSTALIIMIIYYLLFFLSDLFL